MFEFGDDCHQVWLEKNTASFVCKLKLDLNNKTRKSKLGEKNV